MLGIHDGLVDADDRVDVLEEDDPGRNLVRPADLLRLLLVLAEVAGGVEELLRDDRRAEARLGERHTLARLVGAAALKVGAHGRDVEDGDLLAVKHAYARFVSKANELHGAKLQVVTKSACSLNRPA